MLRHGLNFFIEGAEVSVDEIGDYIAATVGQVRSEHDQELLAHDITHAILECVGGKVLMARAETQRSVWMRKHPPNHAGYYYCHLCAGWVHQTEAELDEIEPRSYRRGQNPLRDDNRRMAHAWPQMSPDGKQTCPGNRGKGSSQMPSATLEIAPPDMEL